MLSVPLKLQEYNFFLHRSNIGTSVLKKINPLMSSNRAIIILH